MLKLLIEFVLLMILFKQLTDINQAILFSLIGTLIFTLSNWILTESTGKTMSRDEALKWCDKALSDWPGNGALPLPPDGWSWMKTNLHQKPVLIYNDGVITSGDWYDGI